MCHRRLIRVRRSLGKASEDFRLKGLKLGPEPCGTFLMKEADVTSAPCARKADHQNLDSENAGCSPAGGSLPQERTGQRGQGSQK